MAKKLKDYYDGDCAKLLADKILIYYPEFDGNTFFTYVVDRLDDKSFMQRQDIFVDAFEKYLSSSYEENVKLFTKLLGPELLEPEGMFSEGWWLWPVGRYVERHGLRNWDITLEFIYELTKRYTGEFAVRPLLNDNPKKLLTVFLDWSKDDNVHVRRLASEGMRIRLPWAKKSLAALEEIKLFKQVLTNLKDDHEKFVMKSIGNNLNDLMKENPELAHEIIEEWKKDGLTKSSTWIIKHGSRSLRK
ncbi:DNA alkylation repair protein [Acidaminobacter sp. JC074]|uniref:DNA alkylation repair protein n=1 Tax=Acidaminobacter sp. JC074 TaxID=2530199 RepID=UPI001F0D88F0|nr:DNA alkylation repair protein [Acidaminobacter sp. JC074]MCH4890934.1 DNA alkylation repair protein [Acidaminobacter sp. JC074]